MEDLLFYFIISIIVGATLLMLNKQTNIALPEIVNGHVFLRLHKFYFFMGFSVFLIGVLIAIMICFTSFEYFLAAGILMIFSVLGLPLALLNKKHWVKLDAEVLKVSNLVQKPIAFKWEEISSVKYNIFAGALKVTDIYGQKAYVHLHVVGFKTFMEMLKERTQLDLSKINLPL
ncbi:MAG: hypothetical protein ACKOWX_08160 [Flavobacteriales bacterium]